MIKLNKNQFWERLLKRKKKGSNSPTFPVEIIIKDFHAKKVMVLYMKMLIFLHSTFYLWRCTVLCMRTLLHPFSVTLWSTQVNEVMFVVFTVFRSVVERVTLSGYDSPPARVKAQWRYWSMWTTRRRRRRRRSALRSTIHELKLVSVKLLFGSVVCFNVLSCNLSF